MAAPYPSPALAKATRSLFGKLSGEAVARRRRRPQRQSDDSPAVTLLASAAARRGQLARAGRLLCDSLASNPHNRDMRLALAWILFQRDQPAEALALLDEILADRPGDFEAAARKAFILGQLGRLEAALRVYEDLLASEPGHPALLVSRGRIMLALGHQAEAIADYRHALDIDESFGEAWSALANVKTVAFSSDDIGRMSRLVAQAELGDKARIELHFALGKAHEDSGSYEQSFAHYHLGNELQSVDAFPIREAVGRHVRQSMRFLTAEMFDRRHGAGRASAAPIFIVGMPRSGSTLVEQILASHPDVEGTAELPAVSAIAGSLGECLGRGPLDYADLLPGFSADALDELGQRYIDHAAAYRQTNRAFFIDKMPSNWMHLGLIRLILPDALIVDVRRNPLDCCFSNFAQHFPRGHEFTHKLEDVAGQYRDYRRFMDHFDAVAPGATARVIYEELVDRPEAVIRRLLADLGLSFDLACLRFFASERPVQTPSAQQVRQPINRRGMDRWRPYEAWLGPLVKALSATR